MKIFWTITYMFLATIMFAQDSSDHSTLEPDQRLYEAYGAEYIDRLVTENPFLIKRWNYYLDNAFTISDAIPGKTDNNPEVVIANLDKVNILLLEKEQKLTHDYNLITVYNIKNTNKCLVYKPGKKFAKELREALARN
ncbi:MAG: hypothetical protein AB8F74_06740 [Saprospiraceae bacterium]